MSPAIITLPPSFKTETVNQEVHFKDQTIAEVFDLADNRNGTVTSQARVGLLPMSYGAQSLADLITQPAEKLGTNALKVARVPLVGIVPGWARVTYTMTLEIPPQPPDYGPPEICPWSNGTGFGSGGSGYGINVIGIRPDVVATGNVVTLRISAGFLGRTFKPEDFKDDGDYVAIPQDLLVKQPEPPEPPNPPIPNLPNKITILRDPKNAKKLLL